MWTQVKSELRQPKILHFLHCSIKFLYCKNVRNFKFACEKVSIGYLRDFPRFCFLEAVQFLGQHLFFLCDYAIILSVGNSYNLNCGRKIDIGNELLYLARRQIYVNFWVGRKDKRSSDKSTGVDEAH